MIAPPPLAMGALPVIVFIPTIQGYPEVIKRQKGCDGMWEWVHLPRGEITAGGRRAKRRQGVWVDGGGGGGGCCEKL